MKEKMFKKPFGPEGFARGAANAFGGGYMWLQKKGLKKMRKKKVTP